MHLELPMPLWDFCLETSRSVPIKPYHIYHVHSMHLLHSVGGCYLVTTACFVASCVHRI